MASAIKKSVFFILIMIVMLVPAAASAAELFSGGDFEDGAADWSGGTVDESAAYSGSFGYALCNPFGEVSDSLVTHVLEYNGRVSLEKGKIYILSGYVMNPCADEPRVRAAASRSDGSDTIIVKISGAGCEYAPFSVRFYASKSGEYNFSFQFEKGDEAIGFFTDDISLSESGTAPSSLSLRGQEKVLIPASGSSKIRYTPTLCDSEGETVSFLRPSELYSTASECEGVSYNSSEFTLTVTENAKSGSVVRIDCALDTAAALSPAEISVELTDNLIENSDFNDAPPSDFWSGDSSIGSISDENGNTWLCADTTDYDGESYRAVLSYNTPQLLVGGAVYVLRMTARSSTPEAGLVSFAQNTAFESDGTVYFCINDISSEQKSITAAFSPENSGIYNIALNLRQNYDCTVYIDNIRLCSELPQPTYVTLHAPGNIALPDVDTQYSLSALVRDQLGNAADGAQCTLSFSPSEELLASQPGGTFPEFDPSSAVLTVFPDTAEGEYIFSAVYDGDGSVFGQMTVVVSSDYIGDGGFEHKAVNEWWMASSPTKCSFSIVDGGSGKYASVKSEDSYFMLVNNSYMHLIENVAYVFTADVTSSAEAAVTVFLETSDGEFLPLAQFETGADSVTELFLAESSAVGRIVMYFQSADGIPFSATVDNIALKKAIVSVSGVTMSGNFSVNGSAEADFKFFNNVAADADASACVITWFVSDSAAGEYVPLSTRGKYIYFDTEFAGKYVLFEVAPVCALTGFTGVPVRCMPQYISFDGGGADVPHPPVHEEDEAKPPVFAPIKLEDGSAAAFADVRSHWAEEYIGKLKNAGVINGRTEELFDPESAVLRCEFAKMLCISLGLAEQPQKCTFADVSAESIYRGYIGALYAVGTIHGISETEFAPERGITRAEAAVMLMRAYEKCTETVAEESTFRFYDSGSIPQWAKKAVGQAVLLGIVNGTDDGLFLPDDKITRAETAAVICRLLGIVSR